MQARKYVERHGDNAGAVWLRRRGGDIKTRGLGLTNDLYTDTSNVRTNAKDANTAYLRDRHGKGSL
jgi:hypothetical protein